MTFDRDATDALMKAVIFQLEYFDWFDAHPGQYLDFVGLESLRLQAMVRFHHDAVFHAKAMSMVHEITFVMKDPATVNERRDDSIALANHYARMLAGSLVHVTQRQVLEDFGWTRNV